MTQKQFDDLPGLLARRQFVMITGLTIHKLREAVAAGVVHPQRITPRVYTKYFKHEAARSGGSSLTDTLLQQ